MTDLIRPLGSSGRRYVCLAALGGRSLATASRTAIIMAENIVRSAGVAGDGKAAADLALAYLAAAAGGDQVEIDFYPSRVLLQDHSGIPLLADLAALRSLLDEQGIDPVRADLAIPADLVIDHSVEAHIAGRPDAVAANLAREYGLNEERYRFLRWAQQAVKGLRVVPPGTGIVHQVHLERLAQVVRRDGTGLLMPDTVVGTDSHTPMVNALGMIGWGVGGIEALAALLGEPVCMLSQPVVGIRLTGARRHGVLATDLALAITQFLRAEGVVGSMVEFFGPGLGTLSVPDRATVANMAPEYGCTTALFGIDEVVLDYLRLTGRDGHIGDVADYARAQSLWADDTTREYARQLGFDLSAVQACAAGPRRPQDLLPLGQVGPSFDPGAPRREPGAGRPGPTDGDIAIAAITSCTNTSNPEAMLTAGLIARAAASRGLSAPPWVKASLAPGSRAVTRYLESAGLLGDLAAVGFHLVGYGCTTCIGNSGPLTSDMAEAVATGIKTAAVLSGNRNFDGRIHPDISAAYLMSPPLVVAFALAGTVLIDPLTEPLGTDSRGAEVRLGDLWPSPDELRRASAHVAPGIYQAEGGDLFDGDERWQRLPVAGGGVFVWPDDSTYLLRSPLVRAAAPGGASDIRGARLLVLAGDVVTTDHISPAGHIPARSEAGEFLRAAGVGAAELNSYGSRRGNHEVMARGTFANRRFANALAGRPGGWTRHLPDGELMTIHQAATRYRAEGVPVLIMAGRDYGMGSSRDWAAKGPSLLGVRAVLAESFERIHRSNLTCMGILPLQFAAGQNAASLGLRGDELFDIEGIEQAAPLGTLGVRARRADGSTAAAWRMTVRADTARELRYIRAGGILCAVASRWLGPTR